MDLSRPRICEEGTTGVRAAPVQLSLGASLPDTIVLHEVPSVKYCYTVIDSQTVDPDTHRIIKALN